MWYKQSMATHLKAHLALYVLEVVDSVDGARATVAGHTHSSPASNVVGNLSRDKLILLPLNVFEGHVEHETIPAYRSS